MWGNRVTSRLKHIQKVGASYSAFETKSKKVSVYLVQVKRNAVSQNVALCHTNHILDRL